MVGAYNLVNIRIHMKTFISILIDGKSLNIEREIEDLGYEKIENKRTPKEEQKDLIAFPAKRQADSLVYEDWWEFGMYYYGKFDKSKLLLIQNYKKGFVGLLGKQKTVVTADKEVFLGLAAFNNIEFNGRWFMGQTSLISGSSGRWESKDTGEVSKWFSKNSPSLYNNLFYNRNRNVDFFTQARAISAEELLNGILDESNIIKN